MSASTPRLRLAELVAMQELNVVTHNEALVQLDAFVDLCLLGQFANTPPASPADGDAYLLGATPTGVWSGYAYKIAYCIDGAWRFYTPFNGLRAFVVPSNAFIVYLNGTWTDWNSLIGANEVSIASAATCDLGAAGALFVAITGTAPISSFGTASNRLRFVRFAGTLTLTHNAASLILLGGVTRTTAAGDVGIYASDGSGNWRERSYFYAAAAPLAPGALSGRNRIINGDMRIDQKNVGASTSFNNATAILVDRFKGTSNLGAQTLAGQQSADAPAGFATSLKITTGGTAGAPSAGQYGLLYQKVEGLNVGDLNWGSANAQAVTFSFWVKSSLTGTFGCSFVNNSGTRSFGASFTINAANVWEFKSITVPGDTTGTWTKDTTAGIQAGFDLGVGSSFSPAAGAWGAGNFFGVTGAVKLIANTAATLQVTGVQFEAGTVATPFERVDYATMLARCQRYFQSFLYTTAAASARILIGNSYDTTAAEGVVPLKCQMRAAPTISLPSAGSSAGQMRFLPAGQGEPSGLGSHASSHIDVNSFTIRGTGYSGLTNAGVSTLYSSSGCTITADAEL